MQVGKGLWQLVNIIQADGNFADFGSTDPQQGLGIINMHHPITPARPGNSFKNPAYHKVLAVNRAVLVIGHQNDAVANFDLHPFGDQFWNQDFSRFNELCFFSFQDTIGQ